MAQTQRNMTWFYLSLVTWNLIVSLDSTALSTALPTIAEDLKATSNQAFWTGTSYVLCSAVFQPIFSALSDAFGRKNILFVAITLFTIGTILSGVARDITMLLVGRCIQGGGGGGLLALSYIMMADELRLRDRHKAISTISVTWLVGTVSGPILSGVFTDKVTWRWIFYINLPVCGLSYLLMFFLHTSYKRPVKPVLEKLRQMDLPGAALFISSLTLLLVSLSWGGTMYAWKSAATIAPMMIGVLGLAGWVAYSLYVPERPLIPLDLMSTRTAAISYAGNIGHGIIFFALLYYLPLYYQAAHGYTPIIAGIACMPECATAGPFAAVTGALIARTKKIKPFAMAGWALLAVGSGLVVMLTPTSAVGQWIGLNLPAGIALGILFASLALSTQAACETDKSRSTEDMERVKGIAATLNPFFRGIGQTMGIVIGQAAFMNSVKKQLSGPIMTLTNGHTDAMELAEIIKRMPKDSPSRIQLALHFVDALKPVWYVCIGVACMFFVLTLLTRDVPPLDPAILEEIEEYRSDDEEKSIASTEVIIHHGKAELVQIPPCGPTPTPNLTSRTSIASFHTANEPIESEPVTPIKTMPIRVDTAASGWIPASPTTPESPKTRKASWFGRGFTFLDGVQTGFFDAFGEGHDGGIVAAAVEQQSASRRVSEVRRASEARRPSEVPGMFQHRPSDAHSIRRPSETPRGSEVRRMSSGGRRRPSDKRRPSEMEAVPERDSVVIDGFHNHDPFNQSVSTVREVSSEQERDSQDVPPELPKKFSIGASSDLEREEVGDEKKPLSFPKKFSIHED